MEADRVVNSVVAVDAGTRMDAAAALEIDNVRRRGGRNATILSIVGAAAIVGSWWLIPRGIVAAVGAAPIGGALDLVAGIVSLVAGIVLIVVGIQTRKRSELAAYRATAARGKANDRFDEPPTPMQGGGTPLNFAGMVVGGS